MKLISLHISGFGKHIENTFSFTDGENRIVLDNGGGKSTLAEFLCAMLYGFSVKEKKEREHFRPWSGEVYGGELCFSVGEKRYRVNRTFGATPKFDSFSLRDMDTNLPSSDFTENVGRELFSMDRASFRNTVFFGQQELGTEMTDDIRRLLGEEEPAENGYGAAMESISRAGKELEGKNGPIEEKKREIGALQNELSQRDRLLSEEASLEERVLNKEKESLGMQEELRTLSEEEEQLESSLSELDSIGEKKLLLSSLKEAEEDFNTASGRFAGRLPETEKWQELGVASGEVLRMHEELAEGKLTDPERNLLGYKKDVEDALRSEEKKKRMLLAAGCTLAVLAAALAAVLLLHVFPKFKAPVAAALGVSVLLLLAAGRAGYVNRRNRREFHNLLDDRIRKIQDKQQLYERKLSEFKKAETDLEEAFREYGIRPDGEVWLTYGRLQADYREAMTRKDIAERARISWENRFGALTEETETEIRNDASGREELLRRRRETFERIRNGKNRENELSKEIEAAKQNLNDIREEIAVLYDRERELSESREELSRLQLRAELLKKTELYLIKAKDNMAGRFTEPLREKVTEYYRAVTGEEPELFLDTNGNITRKEAGLQRSIETQSAGLKDLLHFAERLAYADIMFPEEKPFLVLDDPFSNLDRHKLQRAEELLTGLADTYQILYLTKRV